MQPAERRMAGEDRQAAAGMRTAGNSLGAVVGAERPTAGRPRGTGSPKCRRAVPGESKTPEQSPNWPEGQRGDHSELPGERSPIASPAGAQAQPAQTQRRVRRQGRVRWEIADRGVASHYSPAQTMKGQLGAVLDRVRASWLAAVPQSA